MLISIKKIISTIRVTSKLSHHSLERRLNLFGSVQICLIRILVELELEDSTCF